MTTPQPPAEALLIAAKREARVPRLSGREAARRAGISETRWRQLESGVIRVKGTDYPEMAPAETLARMAQAVGATPEELAGAGRKDAAAILEKLPPDPMADLAAGVRNASGLTDRQKRALLEMLSQDGHGK